MKTSNNVKVTMKAMGLGFLLSVFSVPGLQAAEAKSNTDLAEIKAELATMKAQYEQRIQALENRLMAAEEKLTEEPAATPPAPSYQPATVAATPGGRASSVNSFNPAIGIILGGETWAYDNNPDNYSIPGFSLGGESGLADEGIAIGESEFVFTANLDHWFYGQITAPIEQESGEFSIGLEEAFLETLSLPANMTLRFGRFFSGVGYLNDKHKHTWDFADQALPYKAMLGSQYSDDGLQFRWLAPTDLFLEFGGEIMRGGSYPAGGNANSGFGAKSLFVHSGGDVGYSHSWIAGFSWLGTDAIKRESGDPGQPLIFNGSSDIYIADFVWKWAPNGNSRQRNFKFQAEYLWRNEDGLVQLPDSTIATPLDQDSSGWYVQAIYQWKLRWRAGVRFDKLNSDNAGLIYEGSVLDPSGHTPRRFSVMLDYSNSEFARLRLQYNRDEGGFGSDNQIGLQYIMSIGAHGAHEF